MMQGHLERETVSPLLLELARALRARQFYALSHPALRDTLERTTAIWRDSLAQVQELQLELGEDGLVLPDGATARGPGIDEIAQALRVRGVARLRIHRDLEVSELLALIDTLTATPDGQDRQESFEQALQRAGVRHITTSQGEFGEHGARVTPASQETPAESPAEPTPLEPAAQPCESSPVEKPTSSPEKQRSEAISELIKLLAELEKCNELRQYGSLGSHIAERVAAMVQAKNVADGYRAVVVLCRHASATGGRDVALCAEAEKWLRKIVETPGMLDLIIDQACRGAGLSSVQGTQALSCLGASVVPDLLLRYELGSSSVQSEITGVLIAMGDAAFPVLLGELASSDPDHVRRATSLLGRIQNPRAAKFIARKLQEPDEELQSEAAKALARIGTDQAVALLLSGSEQFPELTSVVTTCLGETRSEAAVTALAQIVESNKKYAEHDQREAIRSLGRMRNRNALEPLKRVLGRRSFFHRRRNRMLRIAAARAIGRIGGNDASDLLATHAKGGDPTVQKACRESLERMARVDLR